MWARIWVKVFIERTAPQQFRGRVKMRTSNSEKVAGRVVCRTLGPVKVIEHATTANIAAGLAAAKNKAIVHAQALGADTIINLNLQIAELSDGVFSAIASGDAVRTMLRKSPMSAYFGDAGMGDLELNPFMFANASTGISSIIH